jgi:uncharacterized protein YcfJ
VKDGAADGFNDGTAVDFNDGTAEGLKDGIGDGRAVAFTVGVMAGFFEGIKVDGLTVGERVERILALTATLISAWQHETNNRITTTTRDCVILKIATTRKKETQQC